MRSQPRALIRLVHALNELADLTTPTLGRGDHTARNNSHEHPDPVGQHVTTNPWLARYNARLRDIDRLATRIHADIHGTDPTIERERWRCTCGAFGRPHDGYCGRCGNARETTDRSSVV